ncbi:MAG: GNAT family N-acetyltransferase [Micromonosporaceae bacterium]
MPEPVAVIRRYRSADRDALYRICLATGDSGGDATGLYADPDLLGDVYVGPYLELEPSLAYVLDDGAPAGYVLGALDTAAFEARAEREWWPPLRRRYPAPPDPADRPQWTPDQRLIDLIHHPRRTAPEVTAAYPSHLHVDLLPRAQSGGNGRRLMDTLLAALRETGSEGVHLGVGRRNERAVAFYRKLGFTEIVSLPDALVFGLRLA